MQFVIILMVFITVSVVQGNMYPVDYFGQPICAKYNGYYKHFENLVALLAEIQQTGINWSPVDFEECTHSRNRCAYDYNPVCGYANGNFRTFPNLCLMHVETRLSDIYWGLMFLGPCELYGFGLESVAGGYGEGQYNTPFGLAPTGFYPDSFAINDAAPYEIEPMAVEYKGAKATYWGSNPTVLPSLPYNSSVSNSYETSANKSLESYKVTQQPLRYETLEAGTAENSTNADQTVVAPNFIALDGNEGDTSVNSTDMVLGKPASSEASQDGTAENAENDDQTFVESSFVTLEGKNEEDSTKSITESKTTTADPSESSPSEATTSSLSSSSQTLPPRFAIAHRIMFRPTSDDLSGTTSTTSSLMPSFSIKSSATTESTESATSEAVPFDSEFIESFFVDSENESTGAVSEKSATTEAITAKPSSIQTTSTDSSSTANILSKSTLNGSPSTESSTSFPATTDPSNSADSSTAAIPSTLRTTETAAQATTSPTNPTQPNANEHSSTPVKSTEHSTTEITTTEPHTNTSPTSQETPNVTEMSSTHPIIYPIIPNNSSYETPPAAYPPFNGSMPNISASAATVHLKTHNIYNGPYVEGHYFNQPVHNYFGFPLLPPMENFTLPYNSRSEAKVMNPFKYLISLMEQILFYLRGL